MIRGTTPILHFTLPFEVSELSEYWITISQRYENIKIDKSILWNISKKGKDESLLRNVTDFIKKQGFKSTQEGVETKDELDLAIECGIDYIQGFYFSKAIPTDQFIQYISKE